MSGTKERECKEVVLTIEAGGDLKVDMVIRLDQGRGLGRVMGQGTGVRCRLVREGPTGESGRQVRHALGLTLVDGRRDQDLLGQDLPVFLHAFRVAKAFRF